MGDANKEMQRLYCKYTPTPPPPPKECNSTTGRGRLNGQTSPGEQTNWGKREEEDRACRSGRRGVSVGYGISPPGRKEKNNSVQEITQQAREEKEGSWRSGRRGVEDFNSGMKEKSEIVQEVRKEA
ncbi:Uncharacterized protein Fot_14564 [Forsythia ovata]|uniref:Uncharacterized protein n=1 Tax=Forsythia ovata TaxID=205694 RepID=A0ABD1W736_9LAMI